MLKRAISIRQPYVELILRGEKKFEYRSRLTNIRGTVLLYASKKPADTILWHNLEIRFEELPTGLIVGSVEIADCIYLTKEEAYGFKLVNPKRLRTPYKPIGIPQPLFFWCEREAS